VRIAAVLGIMLLASGAPALAQQQPASPEPGTIDVVGHASIAVAPDLATIQVGVSTRAATPAAALDQNSTAARAIAEAARGFGIAPADIRTSNVSLTPNFKMVRDSGGGSQQQADGYQAENSVEIRVRELPRLGEFLRKTLDGGANRITGLTFGLSDPRTLTERARADAVADGVRQARLLAEAAGVRLGAIKHIGLGTMAGSPRPMFRMEVRAAPPVPVEAGNLDITADVEMTWLIEQP
jgi:uncharacterized protein YggE